MPRTPLTYVSYALMIAIVVLVYQYTRTNSSTLLYAGIAALIACIVAQATDVSRGMRVAQSRIKAVRSDVEAFKKKGWL